MNVAKDSLRRLADVAGLLVDPRVGIVHHVEEVKRDAGAPEFFHFAATACDTGAFSRQHNFHNTGGASVSRERGVAKAVGEAVERYCAALYDVDSLPLFSATNAPFSHVPPAAFALHSPEQYSAAGFPWVPFTDRTMVRWTAGVDLVSGSSTMVPAAMVYVPYAYYRGTGDAPIVQPISTGLACHSTPQAAALAGLCEVIERDAFTIVWQSMLAPPQIRVETLPDRPYDLVQRFERTGSKVSLFDITLDHGIPTILSVLGSTAPEKPALVFAAACSPNAETAAISALEELAHTRRYSQQILDRMTRLELGDDYLNVVDQLDHLNLYCDHRNTHLARFLFASARRVDFDELLDRAAAPHEDALSAIVGAIQGIGHQVVVVDLTTPDVRELGLTVVRCLVPGFHPLFMGHRIRALGGRRLWDVPRTLGYPELSGGRDNPAPHPYP